jgi:hypothetical protein
LNTSLRRVITDLPTLGRVAATPQLGGPHYRPRPSGRILFNNQRIVRRWSWDKRLAYEVFGSWLAALDDFHNWLVREAA